MTPDCLTCRGACCEDLVFPVAGLAPATREFMKVRTQLVQLTASEKGFAIPVRCPQLGQQGLCQCYDERPLVCAVYPAGGEACLETLKRRRTPAQIKEIMK